MLFNNYSVYWALTMWPSTALNTWTRVFLTILTTLWARHRGGIHFSRKKLRPRDIQQVVPGQTATKGQIWDLNGVWQWSLSVIPNSAWSVLSDPTESWRLNTGWMKALLSLDICAFDSALIPLNLINFEGYHGKKKSKTGQPQCFGWGPMSNPTKRPIVLGICGFRDKICEA